MWNISKISIQNFKSIANDEFEFQQDSTLLVYGKYLHKTPERSNSNGSGKSSFLNSIEFGLFGIIGRDLPQEDYILDGEEKCCVKIFLRNEKQEIIIKRTIFRPKNKAAKVEIFVDGIENKQLTRESEANAFIQDKLKISREDLMNYFIVNQANELSFLRASDNQQKEIVSRLANVSLLNGVLESIKNEIRGLETEKIALTSTIDKARGKIESLEEQILSIEGEEPEADFVIMQLKQEFDEFVLEQQKINENLEKTKFSLQQNNTSLRDSLAELRKSNESQDDLQEQYSTIKTQLRIVVDLLDHLRQQEAGLIECPACAHKFSVDSKVEVGKLVDSIREATAKVTSLKNSKIQIERAQEVRDQIKQKIKSISNSIRDNNEEIEVIDVKLRSSERRVKIKEEELIKVQSDLKNQSKTKRLTEIEEKLEKRLDELAAYEKSFDAVVGAIDRKKFWLINLGNKGFKTFLVNKMLEILQGNINFYLQKINGFQVKLEGFKTLGDGSLSEKINVSISKNGIDWHRYAKFSGGQRNRLDIATVFALKRIFNQNASKAGGGLNFLGLDESFDGLDAAGQKSVLETLENLNETCVVISHMNDDIGYANKITIGYENGVSRIM